MKKDQSSESKDKIFDRIFKENAPSIFMPIIERKFCIDIASYEILSSELPRTIGRSVDFFCKITGKDGKEELLHIEFQTADDYEMLERVGEYHGIMFRKHRLPIRHIVIFLGKGKSRMRTELREEEVYRGFELINTNDLNTNELLSSQVPEVIILAILGDYEKEQVEPVLRLILRGLKAASRSDAELRKYVQQLLLLSKLRKLSEIADKIIQEMLITYDYTEDIYYKRGVEAAQKQIEQEREKAKQEKIAIIQSLLSIGSLSIAQIAEVVNVTEEFVENISKDAK